MYCGKREGTKRTRLQVAVGALLMAADYAKQIDAFNEVRKISEALKLHQYSGTWRNISFRPFVNEQRQTDYGGNIPECFYQPKRIHNSLLKVRIHVASKKPFVKRRVLLAFEEHEKLSAWCDALWAAHNDTCAVLPGSLLSFDKDSRVVYC